MEDYSNIWLIAYIAIWAVTFIYYQIRRCIFDAGSVILLSYLIYSILSFVLYNDEEYSSIFMEITIFPFIYLYIMLLLATSPILNFDARNVLRVVAPNINMVKILSWFIILMSLISFPNTIQHISEGILMILFSSEGGQEAYADSHELVASTGHGGLSNIPTVISSAFINIAIFLFFFLLTLKEKHKLLIIGLVMSIFLGIFSSIASGSRSQPVKILLAIGITYFCFKHFFSKAVVRRMNYIGAVFFIMSIVPIIAITSSRFGEDSSSSSILYYTGQENLYFNNFGLDNNGIRNGDRTFPLFKRIIGFDDVPHNYLERRQKYSYLNIDHDVFYTFVGDFTIDYGPYVAVVIFLLWSVFVNTKTQIHEGEINFRQLLLLNLTMCICIQGGMLLFSFSDLGGNLQLIVFFLVYLYSYLSDTKILNSITSSKTSNIV